MQMVELMTVSFIHFKRLTIEKCGMNQTSLFKKLTPKITGIIFLV